MFVPTDEDYLETKLLKLGKRTLTPIFAEMASWIEQCNPNATILNVRYEKVKTYKSEIKPRLQIVCELRSQKQLFEGEYGNFNSEWQQRIAAKFREEIGDQSDGTFDTGGLFVIFSAFEPVARAEAVGNVNSADIAALKDALPSPNIWKTMRGWEELSVFFYTDAQQKEEGTEEFRGICKERFASLITPFDEFGYFHNWGPAVELCSQEAFDRDYRGNWFYYSKR